MKVFEKANISLAWMLLEENRCGSGKSGYPFQHGTERKKTTDGWNRQTRIIPCLVQVRKLASRDH